MRDAGTLPNGVIRIVFCVGLLLLLISLAITAVTLDDGPDIFGLAIYLSLGGAALAGGSVLYSRNVMTLSIGLIWLGTAIVWLTSIVTIAGGGFLLLPFAFLALISTFAISGSRNRSLLEEAALAGSALVVAFAILALMIQLSM